MPVFSYIEYKLIINLKYAWSSEYKLSFDKTSIPRDL